LENSSRDYNGTALEQPHPIYHCVLSTAIYAEQFLNFSHADIGVRAQSRAIFAIVSFTVTKDKSPLRTK